MAAPAQVPGTDIIVLRDVPRGHVRHAVFDFDGTISLLRQGWQDIMAPFMEEMIAGGNEPTEDIRACVANYIDESTGIQTILQMERLVEMVREAGVVPEDQIQDAQTYKAEYNRRLLIPVQERIARLESGELSLEDVTLRGAIDLVKRMHDAGLTLYLASGTDRPDVVRESEILGVAHYFSGGIHGALRTFQEYSKDKVIKAILKDNDLHGAEVVVIGDGPVEIRNARGNACIAVGVASDEGRGAGWNPAKKERLVNAGADLLVPDFTEEAALAAFLLESG